MFNYVILLVILTEVFILSNASQEKSNEVVKVTLYYESLCPYCKQFVVDQFYPGFKSLSDHLEIDLVPYGNAKQKRSNDSWTFECQHGPKECHGNKLQACLIAEGKDQDYNMKFVNCIMGHSEPDSDDAVTQCASKLGVSSDTILACANGDQSDELLAKYGDRTSAVSSIIHGVPSVAFDDEFKSQLNDAAWEDFIKTTCIVLFKKFKKNVCPENVFNINNL